MDRREALKQITLLMGGVVSMSTAAGVLGGCRPGPGAGPYVPQTLTPTQNDLVTALTELILPQTETPGAEAARVNEFIDLMLTDWYPPAERDPFLAGLAEVERRAMADYGTAFAEATPEQQTQLLEQLQEEALAWEADTARRTAPSALPFFLSLKSMTVAGYYTSEIGASQELKYEMVYPAYEGSVPYAQIGRAWSGMG